MRKMLNMIPKNLTHTPNLTLTLFTKGNKIGQ